MERFFCVWGHTWASLYFCFKHSIFTSPSVSGILYQADCFLKQAHEFKTYFLKQEGIGIHRVVNRVAGGYRNAVRFGISMSVQEWSQFGAGVLHFTVVFSTCIVCWKGLEMSSSTTCSTPSNNLTDGDCQPFFVFFSSHFCFVEGLHRLRHKCQAADPLHASEQAIFSVQDVEICGVPSLWVLYHGHDCSQYYCSHDEG